MPDLLQEYANAYIQEYRGELSKNFKRGNKDFNSSNTLQIKGNKSLFGSLASAPGVVASSLNDFELKKGKVDIELGTKLPYAAIHEYGGKIKVTKKMRGFFWAKYMDTKKDKWLKLGIGANKRLKDGGAFTFKARKYFSTAVEKTDKNADEIIEAILEQAIEQYFGE